MIVSSSYSNQARPRDSHEKYLIRSAFDVKDSSEKAFLPSEVLWRPKEAFSHGVSSQKKSWFQILQEHIDAHVTDQGKNRFKLYWWQDHGWAW